MNLTNKAEGKKPNIKENTLSDPSYMKFKGKSELGARNLKSDGSRGDRTRADLEREVRIGHCLAFGLQWKN